MKKFFFITVLVLFSYILFAQETAAPVNGFEKYLTEFIGKDIVVTIVNVDTSIEGKLLEIYQDGIIMETTLLKQKVFILKNSIAFIKKKFELKGK